MPQERDLTHVTNYRTALSPGSFHLKPQKARDWDPSIHPFQQALSKCLLGTRHYSQRCYIVLSQHYIVLGEGVEVGSHSKQVN